MRVSAFPRLVKIASGLCLVAALALASAMPTAAEPSPGSQTPQSEDGTSGAEPEASAPAPAAPEPQSTENTESSPSATAPAKPATSESKSGSAPAKPQGVPAKPLGASAATPKAEEPAEQPGSKIIVNIDKGLQQMTVFVDGIEQHNWPISTGKRGYSTPSGTYTASSMNEIWYSKEWDNAPMYNAVFFTKKGHAIHGTDEEKNLGKPASHGCVRVSRENAKTLFALVDANGLSNTQVVLTGVTPGGEAKIAKKPTNRRYGENDPWFGDQYYYPPGYGRREPQRRGFFGGIFRRPERQREYYGGRRYYYPPPY